MEYFDKFKATNKQRGVPGLTMNAPVVPRGVEGDVGIEIEVEAVNKLPGAGYFDGIRGEKSGSTWTTHADGSLRGNSTEYVLHRPCYVDEVKPMVEGLYKTVFDYKTKLALTNRCSTHVHLNVGGYKINTITSILGLWFTLEAALIAWCGEQRKSNHFCLSSSDSIQPVYMWQRYLQTGRINGPGGGEDLKYSSINVLPIWRFGSIEVRTAPAYESPGPVISWTTFLHNMKTYAVDKFDNPYGLAQAISERHGLDIFNEVTADEEFKKEVVEAVGGEDDFNRSCLQGFRNAQPFILGFPWDEWAELCGAEYVPNPFAKAKAGKQRPAHFVDDVPEPVVNPGRFVVGRGRAIHQQRIEGIFAQPLVEDQAFPVPVDWGQIQALEREVNPVAEQPQEVRMRDQGWLDAANRILQRDPALAQEMNLPAEIRRRAARLPDFVPAPRFEDMQWIENPVPAQAPDRDRN